MKKNRVSDFYVDADKVIETSIEIERENEMAHKGYTHKLNDLIKLEVKNRKLRKEHNASVQGVKQDLANFCKITVDAIQNYRQYKCIPLLGIAYRMAEFFNITVTELYQIEDYEVVLGARNITGTGRGRKKEAYNLKCSECGEAGYAKGLCLKHYQENRRNKQKIRIAKK
ncbi:hypothetical protein [Paenibacillus taichungensis]